MQGAIASAAAAIAQADLLLVAGGAGMGVDSGLPDFRGNEGFWRAYPALGAIGMPFMQAASPGTFADDPRLAWGFYGHRLALYRATQPHRGFEILKAWGQKTLLGCAVYTSNVDGQFQQAGFGSEIVAECHGSLHHLQCTRPCGDQIWPADEFAPQVDTGSCRLLNALPLCQACGALARPNVLMFGDAAWLPGRTQAQENRLARDIQAAQRIVVVEVGAGTAVSTVRAFSHSLIVERNAVLVRINPREPQVPGAQHCSIALGALDALQRIDKALMDEGW